MTFIRSFFNKAVYKATVKRFLWGSVLYFVLLFLSTNLVLMLSGGYYNSWYSKENFYADFGLSIFPLIFSIAVPTVVALLVWRYLHSKKQSLFIHSQPVTRGANYVSTLLAGFTLMAVPVLLNGVILWIVMLSVAPALFSLPVLLSFVGRQLLILFLCFAVATFSAMLTGNSFAVIIINFLMHGALFFFLYACEAIAEGFLYGFWASSALDQLMYSNVLNFSVELMEKAVWNTALTRQVLLSLLFALVFYVASYFLCKKRKVEEVGSVAGFRILNGIFKYGVTLLATMFATAIFAQNDDLNTIPAVLFVAIISVAVYLGLEMALKKSVHVFGSLKGFLVFGILFGGAIFLFSQTTFFGYETRVPAIDDVESVSFYEYYYTQEEPFTSNKEVIAKVIEEHQALVTPEAMQQAKKLNFWDEGTRIHIKYKLKDGSLMERTYWVKLSECKKILSELYTIEDYKKRMETIFTNSDDIVRIYMNGNTEERISEQEEFIQVLQEDVLGMGYEGITEESQDGHPLLSIEFFFKEGDSAHGWTWYKHIELNPHYEKTLSWLLEKGYIFEWEGGYETLYVPEDTPLTEGVILVD